MPSSAKVKSNAFERGTHMIRTIEKVQSHCQAMQMVMDSARSLMVKISEMRVSGTEL